MFIVAKFQNKFNLAALLGLIVSLSLLITSAVSAEGINEDAVQRASINPSCSSYKDSVIGEVDKCGENSDDIKAEEKSPTSNETHPGETSDVTIDEAPETENNQSILPGESSESLWQVEIKANNRTFTMSVPITIFSIKTADKIISYLPAGSNASGPSLY